MAVWPLLEHQDVEPLKVTIPSEQIAFAKDNIRRCSTAERGRSVVEVDVVDSSAQHGGHGHATGIRPASGRLSR